MPKGIPGLGGGLPGLGSGFPKFPGFPGKKK
jgi:signal recognition particle subunit SRP54